MAAAQTSGHQKSIEVTHTRTQRVLDHQPQRDDQPKPRGSTDRELWSSQLSWLLGASSSALGQRGTMAAVVSAIERGGASGSGDFDHHTDLQLGGRWGRKPDQASREGEVDRYRRLDAQWQLVTLEHQAVLVAWYSITRQQVEALTGFADAWTKLDGNDAHPVFRPFTEMVVYIWCRRQAVRRVTAGHGERTAFQRSAAAIRLEVQRLGESLIVARLAAQERPEDADTHARAAMLRVLAKVAGDVLARQQGGDAEMARASDQRADLQRLVDGCPKWDGARIARIRSEAERVVRAGHRAWYEAGERTGYPEVPERRLTKRAAREESVQAFLKEHGL